MAEVRSGSSQKSRFALHLSACWTLTAVGGLGGQALRVRVYLWWLLQV